MQVCFLIISNHPETPDEAPCPEIQKLWSRPETALGVGSKLKNVHVPTALNHSFIPSPTAYGVKAQFTVALAHMPSPLASAHLECPLWL